MRLSFLAAAIAVLLIADQPAWANCVDPFILKVDSAMTVEAHTRAGHPCRIVLYSRAGWRAGIQWAQITVPPAHGFLRTSEENGRRPTMAYYVPQPGFVGHDQFEVSLRYTTFTRANLLLLRVEMTVTP